MILNPNPNEHLSKVTKNFGGCGVVVVFISWLVLFMGGCGVYTHRKNTHIRRLFIM